MTTSVKCPTCNTDVPWIVDREYRPFCSKRCQQIDFGDWATESFKIAGEPAMDTQLLSEEDTEH